MQINCQNERCPENKAHPSGKGRTCGLTITSITPEGFCEHWEAILESEFIKSVKKVLDEQKGYVLKGGRIG
jgi:hypothetical protein